jgi:gliding motility-associated-like protein
VIIQNLLNDSLAASFTVTPNPVDILFPVTKLLNTSENYATYTWNIMGQTITDNMNPVVELPDWGDYPVSLIVFDQNGCSDTITDKILVRGDLYYFIPNAFTPTEDLINDTWYPRGVGFDKKSYQMTIFDRWENIVFMSSDTQQGWNGNDFKGQPCPAGIYGYKITMEGYEGKLPVFIGSLLLIR